MNNAYLLLIGFLFCFNSCKKDPPPPTCPPAISANECEVVSNRIYPQLDVSNNPEAWYTATIEGKPTAIGTGYQEDGYWYMPGLQSETLTSSPDITVNVHSTTGNSFGFNFRLRNPKSLIGQVPGLLSFRSPKFETVDEKDLQFVADSLFSPGKKRLDEGVFPGKSWQIALTINTDINSWYQTNFVGIPLTTTAAGLPVSFNEFIINTLEKEDLGAVVRYTIWCSFQAEVYRAHNLLAVGQFFGKIENGKGKLYIDLPK